MPSKSTPTVVAPAPERPCFSLAQANRALTYLEPIVRDIQSTYRLAVDIQQKLEFPVSDRENRDLTEQHDHAMADLSRYVEELSDTGAELKDYETGLVDFPAVMDGRSVLLCWKLGETQVEHWHETDEGVSGRQSVADRCFEI